MKLSKGLLFVVLAVNADKGKRQKKIERGIDTTGERTIPQTCDFTFAEADKKYDSKLSYQSTDGGISGFIDVDNYPNNANCYVDIQANPQCSRIQVNVVHMGIEFHYMDCMLDHVTFTGNGFTTAPLCGCKGNGPDQSCKPWQGAG